PCLVASPLSASSPALSLHDALPIFFTTTGVPSGSVPGAVQAAVPTPNGSASCSCQRCSARCTSCGRRWIQAAPGAVAPTPSSSERGSVTASVGPVSGCGDGGSTRPL